MSDTTLYSIDHRGVATVTLNRPEVCNAVDEIMIAELTATFTALRLNSEVRMLILEASGNCFCSGTDLNWMKRGSLSDPNHNFEDALRFARLLRTLDRLPIPTIARVHGLALGVGLGIISCCDLAICTEDAWFSIPETRLGLIPAVVGPYIISRIGSTAARRYFLTAEKFNSSTANKIGLVHETAPDLGSMDAQIELWANEICQNSPHALAAAKRLITSVDHRPIDDAMISDTAHRIAHIRTHEEAQEGVNAYLEQRSPYWIATTTA
ncbi:enoyl-CoA hydratase/isomerase family protein [Deefgea tanakiae]|jgi:methylglutaconyl-CoA hydratase|uniref:Enoyl-CoA hydratase/isomerase family protein n=1 Tax=Deefgea tanakiae TaxID=2865840 RepID=A0ABX8Z1U5_9NEIS|nr:enoyl-CoA hydratase-related protein [Deefgea tanakiae]QZA76541.1 enoyl-CoA hydratase/isomerase family protein [Deefgea tanakiae]